MPAGVRYLFRVQVLLTEAVFVGHVRVWDKKYTKGVKSMRSKKITPYDEEELKLQAQSASIVDYLKRKGIVEDTHIDNEKIRKAQQSKAQKAYHNTEVLLNQYRMVVWVLECIPGEIAAELLGPVKDIDVLAEKLDLHMSLDNKRVESRVNAMMKTRFLVDRIHEALTILRKKPGNGEELYSIIYTTYIDPVERKHEEILAKLGMTTRTYYRLRKDAITLLSCRLWSAPSEETAAWLEVLTLLQEL